MIKIVPISVATVNWSALLDNAYKFLDRTISQTVDSEKLKKDLPGFLVTLNEFRGTRGDSCKMLREAGSLLKHVSIGFLCLTPRDTLECIREEVDLAITSKTTVAGFKVSIITGNLEQWRNAVINCSSASASTDLRVFFNQIMMYFEQVGLGEIFANCSRTTMNDNTVRLTAK